MKTMRCTGIIFYLIFSLLGAKANDSLTLAQAYINLSLTAEYFDSLPSGRLEKILPYEESELNSITDTSFISANNSLFNIAYSLLYLNKAKLSSRESNSPDRKTLLQWKALLQKAADHFNKADVSTARALGQPKNPFYQFVSFNEKSWSSMEISIRRLKNAFAGNFNRDIYPDFERIFYKAKNSREYRFDSLIYYASLYNLSLDTSILKNQPAGNAYYRQSGKINDKNKTALGLQLITEFMQLKYLAEGAPENSFHVDTEILANAFTYFIDRLAPADSLNFSESDGMITKDEFFREAMSKVVTDTLLAELQRRYPGDYDRPLPNHMGSVGLERREELKYYFPIPAPFPSSYTYRSNYQPAKKTMLQVDNYLKSILIPKGYSNKLHYYYLQSGYAMTTSLEMITAGGKPESADKRWSAKTGGDGTFSFYEIFKSIFFETESEFRMFAFIISPKAATIQSRVSSLAAMEELIKNSYPSLPPGLENFSLARKTLTALVYQFHQDDIGKVPVLGTKNAIPVTTHLRNTGLLSVLRPN